MNHAATDDLNRAIHLRHELLDRGFTDRDLSLSVRAGTLHRMRRGAYVEGDLWAALSPEDQHRAVARAVLRAGHPTMALSHVSAAIEHGAEVWGIDLREVHTTRGDGKGGRREAGVVHHVGELAAKDIGLTNGVRTVTAVRAAVEVGAQTGVEPALVVTNSLLHAGAFTKKEFDDTVERCKHWPDSLSTNIVQRLADSRIESVGESRAYHLCWSQGLPMPTLQVTVHDLQGNEIGRVDLAWPKYGVFLEFDGRIKYEQYRRPGESLANFLMREKLREEAICAQTGWVCVRVGWADLAAPTRTAERVRRLLASRKTQSAS